MRIHRFQPSFIVCGLMFWFPTAVLFAGPYNVAIELLQENKIDEARKNILLHINQVPTDPKGYLLLASIEEYNKQHAQAIETLFQGLRVVQEDKYAFYFNIGNNYYALNEYDNSLSAFNQSLSLQDDYHPAILNRANLYLKTESYDGALEQYKYYLIVNPTTDQKTEIEKIISLLESSLLAEREQQLLLEQREKELLDAALKSLDSSEDDGIDVDIFIDQIEFDVEIDIIE